jgi:hypothetical protein
MRKNLRIWMLLTVVGGVVAGALLGGSTVLATNPVSHSTVFGEPAGKCGYYINSNSEQIPSPCGNSRDNPTPPSGATARCRDGSWSWSQHPDYWGTCSHHGGVESYLSLHP